MATIPLPPKESSARELVSLARRIERYGVQRRKLMKRVGELDAQIREAKRMLHALTQLLAGPIVEGPSDDELTTP